MATEIRRAGANDVDIFSRVAAEVFDEPVRAGRLKDYLADPNHLMLLAVADGVVVGQCAAVIYRHPDKVTELYIDEIGVTPAFQRRGIARRLLDEMLALGKSCGCGEAWVGTELENTAARNLYRARNPKTEERFVMYLYDL